MSDNLIRWVLFNALLSMVPIFLKGLMLLSGDKVAISLPTLLGNGELLIITTVLVGEAVSRLIGASRWNMTPKLIAAGFSLLLILITAGWYASIATDITAGEPVNHETVSLLSSTLFAIGLLCGGSCVQLADL